MAKQQYVVLQMPTNRKRTIALTLLILVGLIFVIRDPIGAADLARQTGKVITAVANGAVIFLGNLR